MPFSSLQHLSNTVKRCRQRQDRSNVIGPVDICMLQYLHSIRAPALRAESSILSPIPIHWLFAVHMLQGKWNMCLIAEPHQVECWITYIYLPIFDPGRLTNTLQTMIRISSWRITAP